MMLPLALASGAVLYTQTSPRLAYTLHGSVGCPGLVLVNGLGGRQEVWFHQVRAFREQYRVLGFDNRGSGRSESSLDSVTMKTYAADLLRVMDEAGLEKASFVGLSFGGRILQELAVLAPQAVERMVIGGTSCGGAPHKVGRWSLRGLFPPGQSVDEHDLYNGVMPALFGPAYLASHEKHLRVLCRNWASAPPDAVGLERQWEAYDAFDMSDRLADIRCPTLVVHGEEDGLSPMANAEFLAEGIPSATLVCMADVGHSPNVEQPRQFNAIVAEFLATS